MRGSGDSARRSPRSGRAARIVLGAILPAALAVLILWLIGSLARREAFPLSQLLVSLAFAYLAVGLQSLVASLLMEFFVNPRVVRHSSALLAGAVLGALSAAVLPLGSQFVLLGVGVGFLVGGYLRWSYVRA